MTIVFAPTGMLSAGTVTVASATSATVTFTVLKSAHGIVNVAVSTSDGTSEPVPFDTACLEALATGGCAFRFVVTATSATGSSSQSGSSTTPNIQANLDYQFVSPFDPIKKKQALMEEADKPGTSTAQKTKLTNRAVNMGSTQGLRGRLVGHLTLNVGFSQNVAANKVQPTGNSSSSTSTTTSTSGASGTTSTTTTTTSSTTNGTPSPTVCPATSGGSGSGSTPQNCTVATPQPAFVVNAGTTIGLTLYRDGSGLFSELGLGAHGSWYHTVASNQIIQNGSFTYVDLGADNSNKDVGIYEATVHFKVSQWGHDSAAGTKGDYGNVSNLLVMEAGYQNNSGLAQLIASSPQTNTRNRFIGRIYLKPEIDHVKHTTVTLGAEYSSGFDGGPKVVQLFFGTDVNPGKLFGGQ